MKPLFQKNFWDLRFQKINQHLFIRNYYYHLHSLFSKSRIALSSQEDTTQGSFLLYIFKQEKSDYAHCSLFKTTAISDLKRTRFILQTQSSGRVTLPTESMGRFSHTLSNKTLHLPCYGVYMILGF